MNKNTKIVEIDNVGDLVIDADKRTIQQNYFERNIGNRNIGENFIVSRDNGTKYLFPAPPIRPNPFLVITNATNATPIVVSASNTDGLANGDTVFIDEVKGNLAANGEWIVSNVVANTSFTLVGSSGSGAYTGGGIWCSNDTNTPRPPIKIQKATLFYDKNSNTEYPLIWGADVAGLSHLYMYDPASDTLDSSWNGSRWIELTRHFEAVVNGTPAAGDLLINFTGLTENGVAYTGATDFINNWVVINLTQSNEAAFIVDSTGTSLTADVVLGSNGLGWSNGNTLSFYRMPCFKFNFNANNGTSPTVNFFSVDDQRKNIVLYADSSGNARQAIQVMRRDARNYFWNSSTLQFLRTLPAGWYCESDFGILNPYYTNVGNTGTPLAPGSTATTLIYDKNNGRNYMNVFHLLSQESIINSIVGQRIYITVEYGGYEESDPVLQYFVKSSNDSNSPRLSLTYELNFALMNKEITAINIYAAQANIQLGGGENWKDTSSEYYLFFAAKTQETIIYPSSFSYESLFPFHPYHFTSTSLTNVSTIIDAINSGAETIYKRLNHEPDKNRSYPTPTFAFNATRGDGGISVINNGDNELRFPNYNGSGVLEDDNFCDISFDAGNNRLRVKTIGTGKMLGGKESGGIIYVFRSREIELYDLQGVFLRILKADVAAPESIHVTPYGVVFCGRASINFIPNGGGGEIRSINPLWEDFYNGSLYVIGTTSFVTDAYRNAIVAGYDETYKESWFKIQVNTESSSEVIFFRYNFEANKWTQRKINSSYAIKNFFNSKIEKTFFLATDTVVLKYPIQTGARAFEDGTRIDGNGAEISSGKSVLFDTTVNLAFFDNELRNRVIEAFKLNFDGSSADTYGLVNIDFYANDETTPFDTQMVRLDEKMNWRMINRRGILERLRMRFYLNDDTTLGFLDIKKVLISFLE